MSVNMWPCLHEATYFGTFIWREAIHEQKESLEEAILRMRLEVVTKYVRNGESHVSGRKNLHRACRGRKNYH